MWVDVCQRWRRRSEFLNTAISREVTYVEALSSCTLPLASGCSFGLSGTMSLAAVVPLSRSLCFALPSHSDNRVSHVLLPILTFTWLLFLHWMSLNSLVDFFRTTFLDNCWLYFRTPDRKSACSIGLIKRNDKSRFSQQPLHQFCLFLVGTGLHQEKEK